MVNLEVEKMEIRKSGQEGTWHLNEEEDEDDDNSESVDHEESREVSRGFSSEG